MNVVPEAVRDPAHPAGPVDAPTRAPVLVLALQVATATASVAIAPPAVAEVTVLAAGTGTGANALATGMDPVVAGPSLAR